MTGAYWLSQMWLRLSLMPSVSLTPSPRTVLSLNRGADQARFRQPIPPVPEDPQLQPSLHKPRNLDASTVP